MAMKGKEADQVHQAIRQALMQKDFLMLLVNRANWLLLDKSQVRWLRIALLHERIRWIALADDEEDTILFEWADSLREFATEFLAIEIANELIAKRYFGGESILLKDSLDDLEEQTNLVRNMLNTHDRVFTEAGMPERTIESDEFRAQVSRRASERADFIVALAKSKMLEDYGEHEAADAALRAYVLPTR
jgi:hypothetical protein